MNLLKDLFGINTDIEEYHEAEDLSYKLDGFCYKPMPITPEILQRLIPIRSFPNEELQAFAWSRAAEVFCPGSILFRRDQLARYLFYLLEGVVRIEVDDHNSYEISAHSELTKFPICGGVSYSATCVAATKIQVLRISHRILGWQGYISLKPPSSYIEINEETIPQKTRSSQFYQVFYQDFRSENLRVKTIPNVVQKLKLLLSREVGFKKAIQAMQVEPSIALKLVQLSNSGLYLPGHPINNCHNAVYRLGLSATKNLVIDSCLNETFSMQDDFLKRLINDEWVYSLYLSKICRVMAEQISGINPKSAQLAGLVANIGKLPILAFAENFPHEYWTQEDLFNVLDSLQGRVGAYILAHAGFPQELVEVPLLAENWKHDSGEQVTLSDIVILSKLHFLWGKQRERNLPQVKSLPAFAKLNQGILSPESSLHVLNFAKAKASSVLKIFR
jgi:HD-like signal output (HDOD) protein